MFMDLVKPRKVLAGDKARTSYFLQNEESDYFDLPPHKIWDVAIYANLSSFVSGISF
jgi:hypothetical protein